MLLDIAKALSFFLSIMSLYPVAVSAFFISGAHWQERLLLSLARMGLAGCVCLLSGLLFSGPSAEEGQVPSLLATLPVKMYLWTIFGVAVLFLLSWYLEEFCVPYLWRNLR